MGLARNDDLAAQMLEANPALGPRGRIEIARPDCPELRYKLLVDGTRWTEDPANGRTTPDGWGGFNSVLRLE